MSERKRPVSSSARPVYSYYARGNSKSEATGAHTRELAGDRRHAERGKRRLHKYIMILCFVCAGICVGKMVALVPHSRVVVTHNTHGLRLPIDTYTKTANTLLAKSILNRTKVTLNTNGIATYLQRKHPELASVVVAVPLVGNNPLVYVTPAQPSMVVDTPSGLYTIDAKGHVLALVSSTQGLMRLRDDSHVLTPGKQYIARSTVEFAITVVYQLRHAGYLVKYLEIPQSRPYELVAHLERQPLYIRFNIQTDAMQQSGGAIALLKQLGQAAPREYVDVRVLGRAYYR